MRFAARQAAAVVALACVSACAGSGEPRPPTPASATASAGSGQSAAVGTALPSPLVVRVLDTQGNPLGGVAVAWAVATGGGTLSPSTSTTGSDGSARANWTLGPTPGTQTAAASVTGLNPVPFTATATYAVSGRVLDGSGAGIGTVTVDLGAFGAATTSADGGWSRAGLTGPATITATKSGWTFSPNRVDVTGPGSNITFTGSVATANETSVKIVVRWDQLAGTGSQQARRTSSAADEPPQLTHVGARLEYPADNAFFAQAATRQSAETHGVITLAVPPTTRARLYVSAVQYDAGAFSGAEAWKRHRVIRLGMIDSIRVVEGHTRVVSLSEITWVEPTWVVVDESRRAELASGRMTGDKSSTDLRFDVDVRDPLQDGTNPAYDDLFVGLNGTSGSIRTLSTGWRRYEIRCSNPSVGIEHLSTCHFFPFLRGERFNLPSVRYVVPPLVDPFQVQWK